MNNTVEQAREMKDSGIEWIGKVPQDWEIRRLGNFSNMIVPMRDKPTAFTGDIPWIRIEDFEGQYISKSKTNQNVTLELIKLMNMKIYPVGTVLCSCSCNLGVSAIVEKELCSNQTFIGVVPHQQLDSVFLYYLMMSNAKRLNYLAEGSIQAYMSRKKFEQLKVQVPPLLEQQAIANYLDKKVGLINDLITEQKQAIERWKTYKQSLITETVTKGLNPDVEMKDSRIELIGEIPKEWGVKRIKHFVTIFNGRDAEIREGNIPLYGSGGVMGFTNKPSYTGESVLLGRKGTIDKPLFVEGPFWNIDTAFATRPKEEVVMKFFYYCCTSLIDFKKYISGSAIPSMTQTILNEIIFTCPPLPEQQAIADFLDNKCTKINRSIEQKEALIKQLEVYKQSLIYECVTGKRQVV